MSVTLRRNRMYRPRPEALESRLALSSAAPPGSIFAIASEIFRDQKVLDGLAKQLRTDPGKAPSLADQIADVGQKVRSDAAQFQMLSQVALAAQAAVVASLKDILGHANAAGLPDLNEKILALDNLTAGLPPNEQAAVSEAVAKLEFRLGDGNTVSLSKFRDLAGARERAIVKLFFKDRKSISITLGRARAAEAEAEKLEAKAPTDQPGNPGQDSSACAGQSPNLEVRTDDPRAFNGVLSTDGIISCGDYFALPPEQRPVVRRL
jgi:hypothetical protein